MAKKLNKLDLQVLTSVDTAPTGFVAFAAKSDGLYQKIGTVESKLSTTAELLDRVKTAVPSNAVFTDTKYTLAGLGGLTSAQVIATKVNNAVRADNVGGFTVAKNVPSNALFTDTKYTHPANHPATIITQTASYRFVTDAEKST